jgi:hypothetical protein
MPPPQFEEFQQSRNPTKIVLHFDRFFHQIKVCQPTGRNNSIQTICPRSRRIEAFLYEAAQNFEVFSYIQG